ncbi:hypothetical protein V1498_02430 [Peribacillus sp. SCS-26]|uniref:hypothetical protein n=1 Tax=Paraperibacillus marinus TaxID=3115295 RepID=UPI0039064F3D
MRFLKLLNFEISRFIKIYVSLLVLTVVVQFAGVLILSNKIVNNAEKIMKEEMISLQQYLQNYGKTNFSSIMESLWFLAPIMISAAALLLYLFLIWYREWTGKNTFIYRLLMLPASRMNIYFTKALTILLMVLGLVALQLAILPLEISFFKAIVPADYRVNLDMKTLIYSNPATMILIPPTFMQFLLHYGGGIMAVFVLFTAILLERSFRIKGIILGVIYCAGALALIVLPLFYAVMKGEMLLYPSELLLLEVLLGLIVCGISIWMSARLLNKRVSV